MHGKSKTKLAIGVIGCGNISVTYLRNAALFGRMELGACADISADMAALRAKEYGLRALSVDELLGDPEIDLVLNLTIPAAHFDISFSALSAGKHVFTEKPLATSASDGRRLVAEARARGLLLGAAPDTFLGAAGRRARRLMDEGAIGRPVTGTAFMMGRGMEHWHPNPQFYYQPGGGPVFDMGPYYLTMLVNLLGPVVRVMAMATRGQEQRLITADGPFKNTSFKVGTPTNVLSLLEFRSGATVTFGASWDVFKHSNHPIELHGTEGSLRLPDPDTFGGTVSLSARGADWTDFASEGELYGARNWPYAAPDRANYRMLGVADLARSLSEGSKPRASGDLALHVLEIMEAILVSGESRGSVAVNGTVDQPPLLGEDEAASLLHDGGSPMTTSPLAAELSGLDPQARHVLDLGRQAAAPPFETGTPEEARRAYDQGSPDLQGEREPVGLVGERIIAGPGGSLTLRIYRGQGAPSRAAPALLYLHGGGWMIGNLDSHDEICRWFANIAACVVVSPAYRLAPEHKFPAAVEDCRAVLSFMRDEAGALGIDARRIAVAGDSAGGNLAAVLSLLARDDRIPVTAQLLLYPNTDAAQTADSYRRFAEGFGLTASTMAWFRDQYVRDAGDIDDWRVSPLKTKGLAGAAPAFVAIAGHDILADEGEAYARRLQDGGVPVVLKRWPGQIHGFVSMGRHGPASRQAVEAAVAAWRSFDPG